MSLQYEAVGGAHTLAMSLSRAIARENHAHFADQKHEHLVPVSAKPKILPIPTLGPQTTSFANSFSCYSRRPTQFVVSLPPPRRPWSRGIYFQGFTPLMYATKLSISNVDLIRVLLNYGPSPGVEEKDLEEGNTPLHWAIVGGVQSPYALSPILKVRSRPAPGPSLAPARANGTAVVCYQLPVMSHVHT